MLSIYSFGSRVIKHGNDLPYNNENGKTSQLLNLTCCGLGFTDKRGVRVRETVLELYNIKNDARLRVVHRSLRIAVSGPGSKTYKKIIGVVA